MALNRLILRNFRNHASLDLSFKNRISVFTGSNGTGKTSVLEAVSLLGSTRSFRPGKNEDFILRGQDTSLVQAEVDSDGLANSVRMEIVSGGKKLFVDDKHYRRIERPLSGLASIVFSPGDHHIIEGDASERRLFLNRAAANLDPTYLDVLSRYNKALQQRNGLLKKLKTSGAGVGTAANHLRVWDEQLIELGLSLLMQRKAYLDALAPRVKNEYQRISQKKDIFEVVYEPFSSEKVDFGTESFLENARDFFVSSLNANIDRDLVLQSTSIGPHRDEIQLILNGNKVKFYASQGERRTCALALRLGEVSLFRQIRKKAPVLLMDDISSELDSARRKSLVELLQQEDSQVLLTATELPTDLMRDAGEKFFHWDLERMQEV
jgi:DNA replication and repair protein RecF